jgi:hypothetical protein
MQAVASPDRVAQAAKRLQVERHRTGAAARILFRPVPRAFVRSRRTILRHSFAAICRFVFQQSARLGSFRCVAPQLGSAPVHHSAALWWFLLGGSRKFTEDNLSRRRSCEGGRTRRQRFFTEVNEGFDVSSAERKGRFWRG